MLKAIVEGIRSTNYGEDNRGAGRKRGGGPKLVVMPEVADDKEEDCNMIDKEGSIESRGQQNVNKDNQNGKG